MVPESVACLTHAGDHLLSAVHVATFIVRYVSIPWPGLCLKALVKRQGHDSPNMHTSSYHPTCWGQHALLYLTTLSSMTCCGSSTCSAIQVISYQACLASEHVSCQAMAAVCNDIMFTSWGHGYQKLRKGNSALGTYHRHLA